MLNIDMGKMNSTLAQAMEEALNAGARRRSLAAAALATPVTAGKRSLRKSPATTTPGTTVTPDAKRHMSESGSDSKSSSSQSVVGLTAVPPVELFPAKYDALETPRGDVIEVDDTQIDGSPVGWVVFCCFGEHVVTNASRYVV